MTHSLAINKSEIHEILQQLIRFKEISVAELAKLIGLPQPTIQRIAAGVYKKPHTRTLKPIADFFNISINQLKGFEPIPFLLTNKVLHMLPLLTPEQALQQAAIKETTEKIACDIVMGNRSFAMYMPDTSMEPLIPKGSTLLVDPDRTPRHRNFIIVKLHHYSDILIRQLITDGKELFIKPLSPDLQSFKMTLLNKKDTILGVIAQVRLNCEDY
ncbi:MAG: repressor protein [Gammaproteobacteria bacterium]|jgi:SOS-response transcriptional repressor LexA|nr:repressor protein [Gammaproteobacteria bacterium]